MDNIIVTGATGFIGRNFIKSLNQNEYKVYAIVRSENELFISYPNVELVICNLDNISNLVNLLPKQHYKALYHFAWDGSTGKKRMDHDLQLKNIKYTCDIAFVAKLIKVNKLVVTGTVTENIVVKSVENNYLSQNMIYAIAKNTCHYLLNIICKNNNINYVWIQLANIFGKDNTNGNLISYILKTIEKQEIPKFGPCDQPYDFLNIDDTIVGLKILGLSDTSKNNYFLGSGEKYLLKDYLNIIADIYNSKIGIGKLNDDGIKYSQDWFDISEIVKEFNFKPNYSFKESITRIKENK